MQVKALSLSEWRFIHPGQLEILWVIEPGGGVLELPIVEILEARIILRRPGSIHVSHGLRPSVGGQEAQASRQMAGCCDVERVVIGVGVVRKRLLNTSVLRELTEGLGYREVRCREIRVRNDFRMV